MKAQGNARIYLNRFTQKDGSTRLSFSVGIASKKKGTDEYARTYIPVLLGVELQKRISDKTPAKFDVYIKDASFFVNEYNGKTELRLYIADWEQPHKEEEKKAPQKAETEEPELPF